ncbi:Gamma-glutamyl-gamma-aminobutyrate hydrolase PuuD [Hartmannibacter diazotrophicus]|uniref:gamma-glutamyl-gamma-aminobutyrate hydrolase n=1 Tax=Hartmannibacter diazotrophicus TaxID=1482074 RepID=A0A2C9DBP5_9HYPH|nr:gamma-glutamyl-gamma-aminobutyrate hydrolase family protein [Hartmannibacter diazotrophicus]SON57663.1 Gamma-glutamyl-gamma-aminobutyrate hydrolase PuuD [Hartmannibacter diazotrophicus]
MTVHHSPIVLVSSDVKPVDGYEWHAAARTYLSAVIERADAMPLVLPSFGDALDLDAILERVDGVMCTGSRSNVYPPLYGGEASERSEPYDHDRDATTLPLIRRTIELGIPLLCICRGMQELNVALGGTLGVEIQDEAGNMDHRAPTSEDQSVRFSIRHGVQVAPGGCLGRIVSSSQILVNSLHRQAVARLSDRLEVEASAPDGVIEAVSVKGARGFTLGVQWHPEYWAKSDTPSSRIFEAFGDAARERAAARSKS